MELDSRFTEPASPARERAIFDQSRADWVDVQLSRTFIANARTALASSSVIMPLLVYVLFGLVSTPWLSAWAALVMVLSLYRHWIVKTYLRSYAQANAAALSSFFKWHRLTWPFSAVAWAGLMFLYLDKVPLTNQFICILVLVGMGAFSVPLMSARLDCFRPYVSCLSSVCIAAVVLSLYKNGYWSLEPFDVAMLVLIGIFWSLLLNSGARFHAIQRRGYELQYDNERLITSLREQTEAALQAISVKNRLLANAAHDLRQPVHALAFYADWLRNEPDLAAEVVPKILLATDSVNTLFNSLFDFAKIEAGAVQAQFSAVPVCEIVDDLKVQFSPAALGRHIDFRQRITPGHVWTDAVLIRRIVGNLVANAIRYTNQGGVLLTTRVRGDRMWIEVWDTGIGIAPEHQGQVFREFYKASTHSGTEDGFGLGLAIVQRLSDVLGHKVHMKSQLGRGTCMRVELSLATNRLDQAALNMPINPAALQA
jgi:signal transduction histidine kinase